MRQMNKFHRNDLFCKSLNGICDIQSVISVLFDLRLHVSDYAEYGLLVCDAVSSETAKRFGGMNT
jgi:hypothetical protein